MDYNFINDNINLKNLNLPNSNSINKYILKNNNTEIEKALNFLVSEEKILHIHGFLGTGKRQILNYLSEFLDKDTIKLEYYCKASTVCDDILLSFINIIEKETNLDDLNINIKISSLNTKIDQYISSILRPFIIILHSFDDIEKDNQELVTNMINTLIGYENVKVIISTKSLDLPSFSILDIDRKILTKALNQNIFKEFLDSYKITYDDKNLENFYKFTRGYYYYTALTVKIIQSMNITLEEFLKKFTNSGMKYDYFLGHTYVNLIPDTIRNFFWFLRTIRHGVSINALAVFELYDDFSIEYLKNNLMIFQAGDNLYVQDYFLQNIDISIPEKVEIKLHKYIINIYEKQLKESLQNREIYLSRQALRSEIEYHTAKILELTDKKNITNNKENNTNTKNNNTEHKINKIENITKEKSTEEKFIEAKALEDNNKKTEAIELFSELLNETEINPQTFIEIRIHLARLYKSIGKYQIAQDFYEVAANHYNRQQEVMNLNYLYYELTDLYFLMYKNERAIDTIKKVIYSVDTPRSLMVSACTLLGNIYSSTDDTQNAYTYFLKAIESTDNNTPKEALSELFFKFALANDDNGNEEKALEYYNKCIDIDCTSPYKALAYSNLGSCYLDKLDSINAFKNFIKAYKIEKKNNNYDGIYYNASNIAKILVKNKDPKALDFLIEAQQCAEFINEKFYILEASIALGDYYYNNISMNKKALIEYIKSRELAEVIGDSVDISKIEKRIEDMRLRIDKKVFEEIENKYG